MGEFLEYTGMLGISLSMILFFYNHGYNNANRYLAGFFFFIAIFEISQFVALYDNTNVTTAIFATAPTPFVFLIGPMSYLYIRSILRDNTNLSKYDYLHFLMFVLQFIGMIPYYLSSWDFKLSIANTIQHADWHIVRLNVNWIFRSPINSILRPLHILIYIIAEWVLMIRYHRKSSNPTVPLMQKNLVERWLLGFLIFLTAFLINYCIVSCNLFIYHDKFVFQQKSQIFLVVGILAMGVLNVFVLLNPYLLYGLPRIIGSSEAINDNAVKESNEHVVSSHHDQLEQYSTSIEIKLNQLMQKKQPWTDKNFSLSSLALLLEVPDHHLRYYLNHHLNISFPTYRNQLRVNHVRKALESGEYNRLSMEGIGQMAGFSSKSSFFSVFKQETGLSPHEYLLKIQDEE